MDILRNNEGEALEGVDGEVEAEVGVEDGADVDLEVKERGRRSFLKRVLSIIVLSFC